MLIKNIFVEVEIRTWDPEIFPLLFVWRHLLMHNGVAKVFEARDEEPTVVAPNRNYKFEQEFQTFYCIVFHVVR
jgi:hypothetical protein